MGGVGSGCALYLIEIAWHWLQRQQTQAIAAAAAAPHSPASAVAAHRCPPGPPPHPPSPRYPLGQGTSAPGSIPTSAPPWTPGSRPAGSRGGRAHPRGLRGPLLGRGRAQGPGRRPNHGAACRGVRERDGQSGGAGMLDTHEGGDWVAGSRGPVKESVPAGGPAEKRQRAAAAGGRQNCWHGAAPGRFAVLPTLINAASSAGKRPPLRWAAEQPPHLSRVWACRLPMSNRRCVSGTMARANAPGSVAAGGAARMLQQIFLASSGASCSCLSGWNKLR